MSAVVVVVDDEKEIREIARKFLESQGFTVHVARNGVEGVAVFKAHWQEISVVVTEIQMPKMNGLQMIDELLRLKPEIRVVLFTSIFPSGSPIPKMAKLLYKPCPLDELLRSIRSA